MADGVVDDVPEQALQVARIAENGGVGGGVEFDPHGMRRLRGGPELLQERAQIDGPLLRCELAVIGIITNRTPSDYAEALTTREGAPRRQGDHFDHTLLHEDIE